MTIRIRETEDLEVVQNLNARIFADTGAIDAEELDQSTWWVAEAHYQDNWEQVGFGGVWLKPCEDKAFMTRAGVLPGYRGLQIQQKLIRARVAYVRKAGLARVYTYVWVGNTPSLRNLCRAGFLPYHWERVPDTKGENATFVYLDRKLSYGK